MTGFPFDTEEPNRMEAVLGFSLKGDTRCRRVQLSVLKKPEPSAKKCWFRPQAVPTGMCPAPSGDIQLLFCPHCYGDRGETCIQVLSDPGSRRTFRLFVQGAKKLSAALCTEERKK